MNRTDENFAAALAHTTSEISRTDQKASLLLALNGVVLAGLGTIGMDGSAASRAAAYVGGTALVVAVVLGLQVVRPRLGGRGIPADRGSFVQHAALDQPDGPGPALTHQKPPPVDAGRGLRQRGAARSVITG
ncbi:hypothetical protein [Streptomyces albiaxialis]|uniref:hypothetical protein n=1 Tax=Streptomyces albiaxialis TaxID=329523 RepID=UPI0031D6FB21